MKPRFYFDTSVFGGINDVEFLEETTKLFEMVRNGEVICVFSDLTERELENAPEVVKNHFLEISKEHKEFVSVTEDAYKLAEKYIEEKVVGETSFDDCLHIATATVYKTDVLVSWNFKHIVNIFRIRGYNAVNLKNGFVQIDIRSPKEIISYEK